VEPTFIVIDLFCGAGGTTTGFTKAMAVDRNGQLHPIAKVVACVNHDPVQIKSHWANHPDVKHFEEDIRTLNLTELTTLVNEQRKMHPTAFVILWASLECTNFSNAKGGQPRDADSRTLADHLPRYVEALNPDYVQIENVVEFMAWGPLASDGKPFSTRKGEDWMKWRTIMKSYGYYDDWKELNSADFGAHTRRNRLFGCFAKYELPIIWPVGTHNREGSGGLERWKPVREVLDFENLGESIVTRSKPLVEASLLRVFKGMKKFTGKSSFLKLYYTAGGNIASTDEPCPTLTTKDRVALVQLQPFTLNPSHGGHASSIDYPCVVVVARQDKAPLYLITAVNGIMKIPIYDTDSPTMVAIKEYMAENNLSDVYMRAFKIPELLRIQGFPPGYTLKGTQTEQKKGIGNAVVPHVPKAWAEAKAAVFNKARTDNNLCKQTVK
jgi:DNA (cytosine-5)-methyltransferase 1